MGIYVRYNTPSIIRYVEPLTGDLFNARFADCHFDETRFLPLEGGEPSATVIPNVDGFERRSLTWDTPLSFYHDPHTAECDAKVRRILDLQKVAQNMPDSFSDLAKVTRSHNEVANLPARIDVPEVRRASLLVNVVGDRLSPLERGLASNQSNLPKRKCGRPAKESVPQPKRPYKGKQPVPETVLLPDLNMPARHDVQEATLDVSDSPVVGLVHSLGPINTTVPTHHIIQDYGSATDGMLGDASGHEIVNTPENREISVNMAWLGEAWKRNEFVINNCFAYAMARNIVTEVDVEPRSVEECQRRNDWPKW